VTDPALLDPDWEAISPGDLARAEAEALRRQVEYVFGKSPFYQRKFAEAGIGPAAIHSAEDLEKLPFTTKAELRESQEIAPPFGDFLACDPARVARIHRTSGSTGQFVYTALSASDIDWTTRVGGRAFWAAGLRPHHRVVHCLNYQLWMGGFTDHTNLERTGAAVMPFGVGNTSLLVRVIRDAGIDAISGTPSYPRVLENVVREELGIEPRDLGLKLGLFGGEPALEDPAFRAHLEETWGMRAQNANYGVSDILCNFASVCEQRYELHYLGAGAMIPHLVDPETGEAIPIREGARGELVGTSINKEAQPLLRYRTRDVLEITGTGPCECGRTGFRFRVVGRADDMLHVRGINVFPSGIAKVLTALRPAVTGEFQVILDRPPPYEGLDVTVEEGERAGEADRAALAARVSQALKAELNFTARVKLVPAGAIPRTEMGKAIRVTRTY
jgi:phenylacetate-CoA ligase